MPSSLIAWGLTSERGYQVSSRLSILIAILLILTSSAEGSFNLPKCKENLLKNHTLVPDSAFTSSSEASPDHQAHKARYSSSSNVWCPSNGFTDELNEYIEIDFGKNHKIKTLLSYIKAFPDEKNPKLPKFVLQYKRERDGPWYRYADDRINCILNMNNQLEIEDFKQLDPPLIGRWFRIYPHVDNGESKTCLSIALFGCSTNVIEYIIPVSRTLHPQIAQEKLLDSSYDARNIIQPSNSFHSSIDKTTFCDIKMSSSLLSEGNQWIRQISKKSYFTSGLGKLSDLEVREDSRLSGFIGFYSSTDGERERILFRFDDVYKFKEISIHFAMHDASFNIQRPLEIEALVFPDTTKNVYDYLQESSLDEYHTKMKYFRYDSNNNWIQIKSHGENIGKLVLLNIKLKSGWTLIDEVFFDSVKAEMMLLLPETTTIAPVETEPSMEYSSQMLSDPQIITENLTKPTEVAPFGQFAITAIMIICGFGIFLILSTIFACFMIKNRRSSNKRNPSSNIDNCDSFSKLNTSQTNQNPLINFSDLQLLSQQQSLMGVNQGTGSTSTTNDSIFNPNAQNLSFPGIYQASEQSYFTLSPQQQQLMLLMAANGQINNNSTQNGDNSSALYASIRGDGSGEIEDNNSMCNQRMGMGTLSPGNIRSPPNIPLPNPPLSHGQFQNIYGNQAVSTISPSLAQAHLLSQGNFHQILPSSNNFDQNMLTMNQRQSLEKNPQSIFSISQQSNGNNQNITSTPNINHPQQPYLSYINSTINNKNSTKN